jgi:hypothetical protein
MLDFFRSMRASTEAADSRCDVSLSTVRERFHLDIQ